MHAIGQRWVSLDHVVRISGLEDGCPALPLDLPACIPWATWMLFIDNLKYAEMRGVRKERC